VEKQVAPQCREEKREKNQKKFVRLKKVATFAVPFENRVEKSPLKCVH